ncbi:MAG: hypothetical protein ACI4II_06330 [Acutalibacteraceae bacterium]
MINKLFSGIEIPLTESHFKKVPSGTYMVYLEEVLTDGPDEINAIYEHNYLLEIYEQTKDDTLIKSIEKVLNCNGITWRKTSRVWIEDIQRYKTTYEFTIIEKRRDNLCQILNQHL